MPTRLRNAAAADSAQNEPRYEIPGLQFGDTLTWRAGKPIPVGDLLARLQKLASALRNYDVDQVDSRAFTTLAHDLANANLLGHKDKGVRAWTVSCIVDVLKICAPDAPFIDGQLKDIFTVVINSILPALADPSNAYNAQHVYILSSLSESQSILLVTDIPNHDNLIISLFTIAFDVVSGSGKSASGVEVSKSVEYHLKNLLVAVVDEVSLPQEVTDVIISQFLRVDAGDVQDAGHKGKKKGAQDTKQGTLLLKDYPPAYNMAKSLCTSCPEKMTTQITQYFGTVIVDASAATTTNGFSKSKVRRMSEVDDSDDEHEGLADLRKAHRLLRELWRACPDVLLNVIPQIEAEFNADSPALRQFATETVGDITSGIGIAGLAPSAPLDPAAYPLPSIEQTPPAPQTTNPILTPASPKPFATVHASAYQAFYGRRIDRSPKVREAWATAAARILMTSAGGIGLSDEELQSLLWAFAQILHDQEEHVRLAAVRAISTFPYHALINTLGADGGLAKPGTVFTILAERVTDRKHNVREEAIELLARIWGTASRDIEQGVPFVREAVGDIANRLLRAFYTNDPHVHTLIDRALYAGLLPLSFPPIKGQKADSQKHRASQKEGSSQETSHIDPDAVRARRILTLVQTLEAKSRAVFFILQNRQVQLSKGMVVFVQSCEDYNGGVVEDDGSEAQIKERLGKYIEVISKSFPDPAVVSAGLWKFAKQHDRRAYQLIRFAIGAENDYRTVTKAIKELIKRIREGPANAQSLIDTIQPILYRCALITYNRSHVPTIMQISRTDEGGLGEVAHEILKEISARHPEVLKFHIQALCKELEENAPSSTKPEESGAADTLKACAVFARKYPADVPKDRKFLTALTNFALLSNSPRAAKHAVSILLMVAEKKEMYAKDLLAKTLKDCKPDSPHFRSKLATVSQVCLLAPAAASEESDTIQRLAVKDILRTNHSPSSEEDPNAWMDTPDEETQVKILALKILVNQCRSHEEKSNDFDEAAKVVFNMLTSLIENEGEITPTRDTPPAQKNCLRLTAIHFILKLCSHQRKCEDFIKPAMFITILMTMIHPPNPVRVGFVSYLKKYLGQNRLAHRWFTAMFLLAFEPDVELRNSAMTWMKARVQYFSKQHFKHSSDKKASQNVMESIFARLLSLLAHHPDYPTEESEDFSRDLLDTSKYIIFYLCTVATEDNLSLIFHIAQRVKGAQDGITGTAEASERLYVLSDLSQAVIRNYADLMPAHAKGVNLLQTWPGNATLPRSLFRALPSHEAAQEIAEKNYLPEDVASGLEKLVRTYAKSLKNAGKEGRKAVAGNKKRKSHTVDLDGEEDGGEEKKVVKRPKKTTLALRKTPKPQRKSGETVSPEMPSRKSTRVSTAKSYAEPDSDDDDDDAEMEEVKTLTSSPMSSRQGKARLHANANEAESEPDEELPEEDEQHETAEPEQEETTEADVHVHEDEEADVDEGDTEMVDPEAEESPSPLKKNNSGSARKGKGRNRAEEAALSSPAAAAKEKKTEQPTRRTRSSKT
ncbi:Sister chromatid cohesion protein pds5 [Exophiala xenobiotica]|uniref:Sister chromatid cohesion protein pds5 n=1 Tax=Vermiconidia calcicola TaxID=1690605 RepID=A0AAV9PU51_9PEZI|nr:Sister chromatid cohesion protein pds5 [Exophiala xenobiotica]KAK5529534.1 Sister chromatid cohesion protein pds5 [Vermiconidia calcicola]KAK5532608.1 Sister chromatid cohesion protein pds5 [Chaetothyriales sp. CCFEE 6169]KAK5293131.1 Sister chromatid cohesion protein pds5 [Exophiala xenobiotica]KAK5337559.1 Sister chromatid cohesion protein pds5 [Exophiala xenobiotica]